MTNRSKIRPQRGAVAATPTTWLVPPILIPILLTIVIGLRAVYLAYAW